MRAQVTNRRVWRRFVVMALLIPSPGQCLTIAAPVASIAAIIWFSRHGDRVIARLFPHWEWERRLGWLNARANRRAETVLRGLRHLGHTFLLFDLAAILGLSWFVGGPHDMDSGASVFTYVLEMVYLGVCLIPWIYYFVVILGPRIRAEFEEEELQRYRAEHPEDDGASETARPRSITVWDSTNSFRRM
jgi:hypothetical protein